MNDIELKKAMMKSAKKYKIKAEKLNNAWDKRNLPIVSERKAHKPISKDCKAARRYYICHNLNF